MRRPKGSDRRVSKRVERKPGELRSWKEIAEYLHKPAATVKRWAAEGMPVRREGRVVVADEAALSDWFGKAVHVAEPNDNLAAELRRSLTAVQRGTKKRAA